MDCIFCGIVEGLIPSRKVYENDKVLAFYDISPQAKIHVLIISKRHIASTNDINADNLCDAAAALAAAGEVAKVLGIDSYRLICNCGEKAGQTVKHLHFHLICDDVMNERII